MSDNFMYQARPQVREEFEEGLLAQLSTTKRTSRGFLRRMKEPRILLSTLAVLGLVAAVVYQWRSPNAHVTAEIDGVTIIETDYRLLMRPDWAAPVPTDYEAQSLPGDMPDTWIPLEDALEIAPYEVLLPQWVPQGMELATETADTNSLDRVLFLWWWRDDNPNDGFGIRVHPVASYIDLTVWVAPGKWEMVTINNNPAILLRGGFPGFDGGFSSEEYSRIYQDAATLEAELFLEVYWVENYFWRLIWTNDGTFYELSATSEALSEADLIRIAESMQ